MRGPAVDVVACVSNARPHRRKKWLNLRFDCKDRTSRWLLGWRTSVRIVLP